MGYCHSVWLLICQDCSFSGGTEGTIFSQATAVASFFSRFTLNVPYVYLLSSRRKLGLGTNRHKENSITWLMAAFSQYCICQFCSSANAKGFGLSCCITFLHKLSNLSSGRQTELIFNVVTLQWKKAPKSLIFTATIWRIWRASDVLHEDLNFRAKSQQWNHQMTESKIKLTFRSLREELSLKIVDVITTLPYNFSRHE